jgi:hypothetical protein
VLSTAADALLYGTGVFPPMGQPMAVGLWILATAYRFAFTFLGGSLTARLAREPRMRRVWVATGIGAFLGLVGVLVTLGKGPEFGPLYRPHRSGPANPAEGPSWLARARRT